MTDPRPVAARILDRLHEEALAEGEERTANPAQRRTRRKPAGSPRGEQPTIEPIHPKG